MARLARMNLLEVDPHVIHEALEAHVRDLYVVLEPASEDFRLARGFLLHDTSLGLRGPDALHLAIAVRHDEVLHTLDRTLLECAHALGVPATDAGVLP